MHSHRDYGNEINAYNNQHSLTGADELKSNQNSEICIPTDDHGNELTKQDN